VIERWALAAAISFAWGCEGSIGSSAGDAAPPAADAATDNPADASVEPLQFRVNSRSIGAAPGPLLDAGTFSGSVGTKALQLGSEVLPENVGRGDRILLHPGTAEEAEYFITARMSDSLVEIDRALAAEVTQAAFLIERAYSTIAAWSADTKGDLVSEKRREEGICYDDAVFTENVVLSGSTVDEEHYRILTVAQGARHQGLAGTGVVIRPTMAGNGISVHEDYARIEWLEVTDWTTDSGGSYDGINIRAQNVLVQYVIVHDDGHGVVANSDAGGIQLERDQGSATVRNSVVYNVARIGIGTHSASNTVLEIENSTTYGCVQADNSPDSYGCISARGDNSVVHATNVIALNAGGLLDFFVATGAGASFGSSDYNLSSDASSPGDNSIDAAIPAEVLVSVEGGVEDCHLAAGSVAQDSGTALTGFADDIDQQARAGLWDIGADEI
jgi:hypothetical protein